jgi:DNA helicase IV
MTADRNSAFGQEVWKFVRSVLPNRNAVRIARDIALGRSQVFKELGVRQIEQLGTRLRGYSKTMVADARGTEDWSNADLALMFWCNNLVNGASSRYAHVLLDEAQDLTGLELKAIRSAIRDAPVTVAGDLKQSTTFGAVSDWNDVMNGLGKDSFVQGNLTVNYRVPNEIYSYALNYLSDTKDVTDVSSSLAGGTVSVHITEDRRESQSEIGDVLKRLEDDTLVGVLASQADLEVLSLPESNDLLLATPFDSKGLEVDHLILVEPTSWFDQTREMRRLMFVALTRATKSVTIVQSKRAAGRIVVPGTE